MLVEKKLILGIPFQQMIYSQIYSIRFFIFLGKKYFLKKNTISVELAQVLLYKVMVFQKDYCPNFSRRQFNKIGVIGMYGFAAIT
jgi:hypothetical protein